MGTLMFWRHGNIPGPLYEVLPALYAIVGAWALAVGEGVLVVISCMLFWLAAALVHLWRRDARLAQTGNSRRKGRRAPGRTGAVRR